MVSKLSRVLVTAVLIGFMWPRPAQAGVIDYEVFDAPDVVPGMDLWVYSYTLRGFDFVRDQGFAIYFPSDLHESLSDRTSLVDWDSLIIQPDPSLDADGFFDALARVDAPSLADAFLVEFVWLAGPGAQPGSQQYELYEMDAHGELAVIGGGQTQPRPDVPEPTVLFPVAIGVIAATARGRRFRRKPTNTIPIER